MQEGGLPVGGISWQIAVCDDHREDRQKIAKMTAKLLEEAKIPYQLSEYASGLALLADIRRGVPFQLLLLDTEMRDMDGITLASTLREEKKDLAIVFISRNLEMAMRGYEVSAARYLAEPPCEEKLKEALLYCHGERRSHAEILLPTEVGERRISLSDIQFVEAFDRGTKFNMKKEAFESRWKISEAAEKLSSSDFLLCHRGFVVNLHEVEWIRRYEFVLKSGARVPIGKGRYAEVHQRFVDFITN